MARPLDELRVVQVGLGPIGRSVAELVCERPDLALVGAVDPAPDLVGRPLAELVRGLSGPSTTVAPSLAELDLKRPADVAAHCTGSRLEDVLGQLLALVSAGISVASTCEELAYPWLRHRPLAGRLDAAARKHGATVVGTGVNPGFVCDALPIMLGWVCAEVERVAVWRVQDASTRRGPFQRKIGCGLSEESFREAVREGRLGHMGFPESAAMVAVAMLGKPPERVDEGIEPVLADEAHRTEHVVVQPGEVRGLRQACVAHVAGRPAVELHLEAYLGAPDARDEVQIDGRPPLRLLLSGGVPGDLATAAATVNALSCVAEAPAGLLTVAELPLAPGVRPR
jgi:4-hydroxy-tetrahydrodipicolinate reductase